MSHSELSRRCVARGLALAAVIILVASCAATTASPSGPSEGAVRGPRVGAKLPAFKVKDFDGKVVDRTAWHGKVLLLDLWASWCAPCKEELPILDGLAERLARQGVVVLAVSIDEDREDAVRFLDSRARPWALALAHDPEGRVAERLAPPKMPTSYIVDRAGIIRHINEGFQRGDAEAIEARLVALAAQEP
jgi:cytochrome c biogenesis protein CcmG, thiol:disulfide interchange protein DsbE